MIKEKIIFDDIKVIGHMPQFKFDKTPSWERRMILNKMAVTRFSHKIERLVKDYVYKINRAPSYIMERIGRYGY